MKNLTIKRLLATLALAVSAGALSGCYISPGYSYVQGNGYGGDVYYGSTPAAYSSYYSPYYGYYGGYPYGYYGYGGWGCCYGPVVAGGWWGGGYYGRGYYGRGGYYRGGWHGGGSGGHASGHSGGGHSGGGGGHH
jgi:hypothetical protein